MAMQSSTTTTPAERPLCYADYHIYTREDAAKLINGRNIYIWGAGQKGRGFLQAMKRNNLPVKAFLDSSPKMIGQEYQGVPIIDSKAFFEDKETLKNSYILTATVDKKNKELFRICEENGLVKHQDFINIQELSPFYPTVEIAGTCNIKCIACPRGNSLAPPVKGGMMSAETYKKVITKLVAEIPFLYLVDLYVWGEPLLNKELPEIIQINNELGIASGISSNLNASRHIERVIAANPAQFRVSISGFGSKNYEISHKGAHWEVIHKNLLDIAEFKKKHNSNTLIEVYYHVNNKNMDEYPMVEELCKKLGYNMHPSISMIFPDYAMDYSTGKELPVEAKRAIDLMPIGIDEMLADAKRDRKKPCLLKRIVPVINWDGSVLSCCNYSYHVIHENFLEVPIKDIIQLRYKSTLCGKCQENALHRYFNPVGYSDRIVEMLNTHNKPKFEVDPATANPLAAAALNQ